MKKNILITCLLLVCAVVMKAQPATYTPTPENLEARKWFEEARFGMFVHFGPYAVLANGEWVMTNKNIKVKDYHRLIDVFNPQDFSAKQWVDAAKSAGMKYIVLTSRHHDGFSLWDTKQSDWNIMNTHYKKDLIKQLSEECQKQGIKLGFYYSLLDWSRDDYQWRTGRTGQGTGRTAESNWPSYINFMKAQLTELLTNYGPVSCIWFDGHWDQTAHENRTDHSTSVDWHYDEIYGLIHKLQPSCLVANNHHLPDMPGEDFQIFERDLPGENKGGLSGQAVSNALPLESCETMNANWGYSITDNNYKSAKTLIHTLVRGAGYGGNLLLNVGPMANGEIQPEFITTLAEIGEWTSKYGQTIYGTKGGFLRPQAWGAITQKDKTYYIHILRKEGEQLKIQFPEKTKIQSAAWLDVNQKLAWKQDKKTQEVVFEIADCPDMIDAIIEVKVK